jgi:hypothetical protein
MPCHRFQRPEKLYNHGQEIRVVLATSIRPPSVEEVKKLSISDLAIASGLADSMRDRLREYISIDPFTTVDPFGDKDDCTYSVVLDRENPNRVVAMIANKRDSLPQLPWSTILGERLTKVLITKEEAKALKQELMPKEWGNFYPYRRNNKVAGYLMFAFQVCGLR